LYESVFASRRGCNAFARGARNDELTVVIWHQLTLLRKGVSLLRELQRD
jgi:hypothetical protein